MDIESIRDYCLEKNAVTEGLPFGNDVLVFKVAGKMFLLASLDEQPLWMNLKCDPEKAIDLRERYDSIRPGYHMSKIHWNTVEVNGELQPELIQELIDNSYDLVVAKLTKKTKEEFFL
jgi:predicted DNA-binding protein (MmcQ/YjbR family)|tara:strand:+ start:287 stop:640 length:354 start_codon:yes stop_codon:yes gene_type:complete